MKKIALINGNQGWKSDREIYNTIENIRGFIDSNKNKKILITLEIVEDIPECEMDDEE